MSSTGIKVKPMLNGANSFFHHNRARFLGAPIEVVTSPKSFDLVRHCRKLRDARLVEQRLRASRAKRASAVQEEQQQLQAHDASRRLTIHDENEEKLLTTRTDEDLTTTNGVVARVSAKARMSLKLAPLSAGLVYARYEDSEGEESSSSSSNDESESEPELDVHLRSSSAKRPSATAGGGPSSSRDAVLRNSAQIAPGAPSSTTTRSSRAGSWIPPSVHHQHHTCSLGRVSVARTDEELLKQSAEWEPFALRELCRIPCESECVQLGGNKKFRRIRLLNPVPLSTMMTAAAEEWADMPEIDTPPPGYKAAVFGANTTTTKGKNPREAPK